MKSASQSLQPLLRPGQISRRTPVVIRGVCDANAAQSLILDRARASNLEPGSDKSNHDVHLMEESWPSQF